MKDAWFLIVALLGSAGLLAQEGGHHVALRSRAPLFRGSDQWIEVSANYRFEPTKSALIVCDMWDKHWCSGANVRVAALVKKLEPVLETARRNGVIVDPCAFRNDVVLCLRTATVADALVAKIRAPAGKEPHIARIAHRRFGWRLRHFRREGASGLDLRTSRSENCA